MLAMEFQFKVINSTQVECKANQLNHMHITTPLKIMQFKEICPMLKWDKFQ
jgi:hypothetical protein